MENNLEAAIACVFYLKIIQELNIVESNIIWVSVLENLKTILEKKAKLNDGFFKIPTR